MATTPIYLLPYPIPSDPVDVAEDIKKLAQQSEIVLSSKASLESPMFTGTPTIMNTPPTENNSKAIASTEYVKNQGYLTIVSASTTYASLTSPTFSGIPSSTTASVDTNNTQIATTAFVINQEYAKLFSPSFSGSPTAPTPISSSDDTKIATTAFVKKISSLANVSYQTSSYILQLSDAGNVIEMDNLGPLTLTIPNDTTANFDIGTTIHVVKIGLGSVALTPDTLVTIQSTDNSLKINKQFSPVSLYKRSSNVWVAYGESLLEDSVKSFFLMGS